MGNKKQDDSLKCITVQSSAVQFSERYTVNVLFSVHTLSIFLFSLRILNEFQLNDCE